MSYEAKLMPKRDGTEFEWCVVIPGTSFKVRCKDEEVARATAQLMNGPNEEEEEPK